MIKKYIRKFFFRGSRIIFWRGHRCKKYSEIFRVTSMTHFGSKLAQYFWARSLAGELWVIESSTSLGQAKLEPGLKQAWSKLEAEKNQKCPVLSYVILTDWLPWIWEVQGQDKCMISETQVWLRKYIKVYFLPWYDKPFLKGYGMLTPLMAVMQMAKEQSTIKINEWLWRSLISGVIYFKRVIYLIVVIKKTKDHST